MTMLNGYGGSDEQMNLKRFPMNPYDQVELPDYHVKSIKATHFGMSTLNQTIFLRASFR
jgi:hypothetical protein